MNMTEPRTPSPRAAWIAAVIGVGMSVGFMTTYSRPVGSLLYVALGVGTIGSIIVGVRRWRPTVPRVWVACAIAPVFVVAGTAVRAAHGGGGFPDALSGVVPPLVTLPGYLCLIVALYWVLRAREGQRDLQQLGDALVILICLSTGAWFALVEPIAHKNGAGLLTTFSSVANTPMDILLFCLLARIVFAGRRKSRWDRIALGLLVLTIGAVIVGDLAFGAMSAGWFSPPAWAFTFEPCLALVAGATLALHPAMATLTERQPATVRPLSWGRACALCLSLGIVAWAAVDCATYGMAGKLVFVGIGVALILAVVGRIAVVVNHYAAAEARLIRAAAYDDLTGLPNRPSIVSRINDALDNTGEDRPGPAVLFCDLDGFKRVNDTWGHVVGDELLRQVGKRLARVVRAGDDVARLGGDEFVVVCDWTKSADHAEEVARRIVGAFAEPFVLSVGEVSIGVSVGIARGRDGVAAEELVGHADAAMYHAKETGRGRVVAFDQTLRQKMRDRSELEAKLNGALGRSELWVAYQPIVRFEGGGVVGFEALVRWTHPELGNVAPNRFIPVAEDSGFIVEIGLFVLRTACDQLAAMNATREPTAHLTIAVNVSPLQLRSANFVEDVTGAIVESGISPSDLWLEITETAMIADPDAMQRVLAELHDLGVRLAADDFGTGYSSLSNLRRFPLHEVKIDRSFVAGLGRSHDDKVIVSAVLAMGRAIGLRVVAEGVETAGQAVMLDALGCEFGQGWLFAPALDAHEASAFAEASWEDCGRNGLRVVTALRPLESAEG